MSKRHTYKFIALTFSFATALVGCSSESSDRELEGNLGRTTEPLNARKTFGKTKPQRPKGTHRLVVKFKDDLRVRSTASGGVLSDAKTPTALSNASAVTQIAQRFDVRFSPLIRLPEERLETIKTRATLASKQQQPDLAGILVAEAPDARLQAAADALYASPLTELVYFQELTPPPPQACTDIAPPTPSYRSLQGYHGPNPGVNMTAAWALGSARGAGIKIADCEYGFVQGHEDLCGVVVEPGQTVHPEVAERNWHHHGTAVLGELIGLDNSYGCTGLVPDASPYFFPEWTVEEGSRRVTAVANAIASVDAGDVVLLEMQAGLSGRGYGPAELDPAVWLVVKSGTDAGVIVVAAAGNGGEDLDSSFYDEYRGRGDSGAIIVGAGTADTAHQPLWFTSYGSRVNVQGWGESVVSTGYGTLAQLGGDVKQSYASSFGGTSSASPIVAASVASLQSYAVDSLGRRLTPLEVRDLLMTTGIPQGAGVHIGPLPDVIAAIEQLESGQTPFCGDAVCNGNETCQSCASDCGGCPSCVPSGCASATPVTIPYAGNGAMNTCVFFSAPTSHVNSWNMSSVELNGVDVTNLWVGPSNYPATCNGGYYLRATGNFGWSHVEAQ
jgi:serine protease